MVDTFYIALLNKETKKFEIVSQDEKPREYLSENEALDNIQTHMTFNGKYDVMFLKRVYLQVDLKVSKKEMG